MKCTNMTRQILATILTIAGLMSWNTLSIHHSGFAATSPSLTKLGARPASSPLTNGKIASAIASYSGNPAGYAVDIYTMNPDGSDRVRLTSGTDPAWSPDGTQIAFVSRDGAREILLMDADGSNQRHLNHPAFGVGPCWSPDGTKIAFSRCGDCDSDEVYIMNADGSDQKIVGRGSQPSWSPDGSKISD